MMIVLGSKVNCCAFIRPQYLKFRGFTSSHLACADSAEKTTHFGFETVPEHEKEEKVHRVFENVATRYDLMNDIMSGGIHRLWKNYFVSLMNPRSNHRLLDVAGGTGDIGFRYLQYIERSRSLLGASGKSINCQSSAGGCDQQSSRAGPNSSSSNSNRGSLVTVCDINESMLEVGKQRAVSLGLQNDISWLLGNAESLPLNDKEFEIYSIAFGIRNVTHIDAVLSEAYRVLKGRGRFFCLEFSRVENNVLRRFYDEYSFQVIPVMGKIVAGDWNSYQYLVESIRKFPQQEDFSEMIREAGFKHVGYKNLFGGVAAIHYATKL